MADDLKKVCLTCHHWRYESRQCLAKAPTRDLKCQACWPITTALMWCGEHVQAEQVELVKRKAAFTVKPMLDVEITD